VEKTDLLEKPRLTPQLPKISPVDLNATKSVEKKEEKKEQPKVETQKEALDQKLNWKNSLKSFELQEQATLEGILKNID